MSYRLLILAATLAAPLFGQSSSAPPAAEIAPQPDTAELAAITKLTVARNGGEVVVTWDLPAGVTFKGVDIYRNIQETPKGRTRVDYVRPSPALFADKVPDPAVEYWYWIKVGLPSGAHFSVGPVKTPAAAVWTP